MATCILISDMVLVLDVKQPSVASHLKGLRFLFSSSVVKVHGSKAYRNMNMTRERTSYTFDPRNILLSLHIGFSFVRAAVACAILKRPTGLHPSSKKQLLQGT